MMLMSRKLERLPSIALLSAVFGAFACGEGTTENLTSPALPATDAGSADGTGEAEAGADGDGSTCPTQGTSDDPATFADDFPRSCAFSCSSPCAEPKTPYACPHLGAWTAMPHAPACGCFDENAAPSPVQGTCSASTPSADAVRKAGPIDATSWVLPDGHVVRPAGKVASLAAPDLRGTFPMSLAAVPGTGLALLNDGGIRDNALRLLDLQALAAGSSPDAAHVRFAEPAALHHGVVWLPPSTALASGGDDGKIYAFKVDAAAKTLARDAVRDIDLGEIPNSPIQGTRWYSGPMALAAKAEAIAVAPSCLSTEIQVRSLAAASWGKSLGTVPLPSQSVFELAQDPFDPTGNTFYATLWIAGKVAEIDVQSFAVTRTLEVGKNPEGIAFLNESAMAVAGSDDDSISIVDRTAWVEKTRVDLRDGAKLYGHGPSALAFDAARSKLYAALSGVNAVAVLDVAGSGASVTVTPAGRIPTAWWPTALLVRDDGSLAIASGKGFSTGPYTGTEYVLPHGGGPVGDEMKGAVQHVPAPSASDLAAMTATAEAAHKLADTPGYPVVSCPGAAYDFPVPKDSASGPSKLIQHVLYVVRENKTFDAVFGDLAGVDGDPALVMAPGKMEQIWANGRALAREFSNFDNYYTDAEESFQGQIWNAFGRITDYDVRTIIGLGRPTRPPSAGTTKEGKPLEGSLFDAFEKANVGYANMGELVGLGKQGLDQKYPGLIITISRPDVDKACYIAARARVLCNLPPLSFVVLPNDHTQGGEGGVANPAVMIAVNDEATGMIVDAVSHSPMWKDTLVIVTEDDPQHGGDHVDLHRTLLFMASPWVKRGYVSHGHYDTASVVKLVATILGVPYPNDTVAQAPLPLDAFTSTPDFRPYKYQPRTYEAPCNPKGTGASAAAQGWDFSEVDEQPGLAEWVWRIVHDGDYGDPGIAGRRSEP